MGTSRLEINLRRLIAKCELMVKDKSNKNNEKLDKYINSLDEMLIELEKNDSKPGYESMVEYSNRIEKLKQILNKINSLTDTSKRKWVSSNDNEDNGENKSNFEKLLPSQDKTKDRQKLLGIGDSNSNNVSTSGSDVDVLLNYHTNMQEKIADEMLILTRNLKEQTILAGSIIRKDTEVLKKSSSLAEENFDKLKVESEKLTEHSKRAWKCWMWVMIFIVMAVFINMVLFMKVMKKRTV